MTCKDCLYFKRCFESIPRNNYICDEFSDLSEWVHLPCKVGDKIYAIARGKIIEDKISDIDVFQDEKGWYFRMRLESYSNYVIGTWNDDIFDTREEAEKKLEEMK